MTDNPHNLPWRNGRLVPTDIYDATGSLPGVNVRSPELATLIIRAVNNHDTLVAALHSVIHEADKLAEDLLSPSAAQRIGDTARLALAGLNWPEKEPTP